MSTKLTLEDRYFISMYSRKLPCTVSLRFTIEQFHQQIEITSDEVEKYEVTINPENGSFISNNTDYIVEYDKFPSQVIDAISRYIDLLDQEQNEDNVLLQNTLTYLSKVI